MNTTKPGAYSAANSLVDYILGVTFEVWEEGRTDLLSTYYDSAIPVYGLDGIVHGAQAAITATKAMLAAFPDRILLGDDVIGSGDARSGYSSHRVLSPMTNRGDSLFGAATGRKVRIMNMADCVVRDGVIVEEWLARDNLALVGQLGFDPMAAAKTLAEQRTAALSEWFANETTRLHETERCPQPAAGVDHQALLDALLISGAQDVAAKAYPHYSVLHRSPVEIISGGAAIAGHYSAFREAFSIDAASVDHVCVRNDGHDIDHVAIRWSACGMHRGNYLGLAATDKPVYIMGVTHRRMVGQRIAVEWTVFDQLGVLAQLL